MSLRFGRGAGTQLEGAQLDGEAIDLGARATATLVDSASDLPSDQALAWVGLFVVVASSALLGPAAALFRRIVPDRNVGFVRWAFGDLLFVAAAFVLGSFLGAGWVAGLAEHTDAAGLEFVRLSEGGAALPKILVSIGVQVVVMACCSGLGYVLATRREPSAVRSLGLEPKGSLRAVGLGALGFLIFAPAVLASGWLWSYVVSLAGESAAPQAAALQGSMLEGTSLWVFLALVVLVVPLCEEFLFRGYLQPVLVQNFGDRGGVLIGALVFAMLHETTAQLSVFILALVLGTVMLRSRRLASAWCAHALNNGVAMFLVLHPSTRDMVLGG